LEAAIAVRGMGGEVEDRVVVEGADRPMSAEALGSGRAEIVIDDAERVEIEVEVDRPGYLVLADTYDPGWRATLDGRPAPICAANLAFRAVYVAEAGRHRVVFRYEPVFWAEGLALSCAGLVLCSFVMIFGRWGFASAPERGENGWRGAWFGWLVAGSAVLVFASAIELGGNGVKVHGRWRTGWHAFTWGAAIEAIKPPRPAFGARGG
jgi:hypothetical protein